MRLTRQQRRKNKRIANKNTMKEGKTLLGRKMLDQDSKSRFDENVLSSKHTALMPFCILVNEDYTLNDFTYSCREGAETFLDNEQTKYIIVVKKPGVELPAPYRELMKIGTRIFRQTAPSNIYVFFMVECALEDIEEHDPIGDFLKRLDKCVEDDSSNEWLSEYIYRESD